MPLAYFFCLTFPFAMSVVEGLSAVQRGFNFSYQFFVGKRDDIAGFFLHDSTFSRTGHYLFILYTLVNLVPHNISRQTSD
jgi:hypothetical protein